MSQRLRIAVLGAGRIGSMHAEHVARRVARAELVTVVDLKGELAQSCARSCGIDDYGESVADVLSRPDVEAVAICTSSPTHTDIIEQAASAGKHIFCEKPIDLNLSRIDRALEAVEKAGILLQVGFQKRFDSSYRRVRQAIDCGEIGQPHAAHLSSRDPAPPPIEFLRSSGGLFLDMMIHDFDMVCYLLGHEVASVYAAGSVRVDPAIGEINDVDTATVVVQYHNGTLVTIQNSRLCTFGYDQRVEVFGSRGSVRIGHAYPHTAVVSSKQGIWRDVPFHFFLDRYKDAYIAELQAFVDAVLDGSDSALSGMEGRMPVVLGLAAQRSLESGRPVPLTEITAA